jgi:putative tryptophan/tyrosine transport system substrate-binding protein
VRRRTFITLLGGAAASSICWPLAAHAQQGGMRRIGFLGAATPAVASQWVAAFVQRLRELGWIENRNITIEYRWAEGRSERFAEIAREFVRLKVDVIMTWSGGPVVAAKQATTAIPIVFALQTDPVGSGLVDSLSRPGGNVTGLSVQQTDTVGKRLELLREFVPSLGRLAIMANGNGPGAMLEMAEVTAAARKLGLEVIPFEIRQGGDIAVAFDSFKSRPEALYVSTDPLVFTNRIRINTLAQSSRLPTMYSQREYVEAGGFLSYGANISDLFRRSAELVDKILRGTKPADLPVEQPTKFDLVINLTTAKALGLDVSPTLLARADEVIE